MVSTDELHQSTNQQTLAASIACVGVGLHTGQRVALRVRPAYANTGIRFVRRDVAALRERGAFFDLPRPKPELQVRIDELFDCFNESLEISNDPFARIGDDAGTWSMPCTDRG